MHKGPSLGACTCVWICACLWFLWKTHMLCLYTAMPMYTYITRIENKEICESISPSLLCLKHSFCLSKTTLLSTAHCPVEKPTWGWAWDPANCAPLPYGGQTAPLLRPGLPTSFLLGSFHQTSLLHTCLPRTFLFKTATWVHCIFLSHARKRQGVLSPCNKLWHSWIVRRELPQHQRNMGLLQHQPWAIVGWGRKERKGKNP